MYITFIILISKVISNIQIIKYNSFYILKIILQLKNQWKPVKKIHNIIMKKMSYYN
jgi:hypothetical protein